MSQLRRMIAAMPEKTVISDYVQDGLVLAYDGYQAPSGGVWKDLSPSHNDLIVQTGASYDADLHCFVPVNSKSYTKEVVPMGTEYTWELVWSGLHPQDWRDINSYNNNWPYLPGMVFAGSALLSVGLTSGGYVYLASGASWAKCDDGRQPNLLQLSLSAAKEVVRYNKPYGEIVYSAKTTTTYEYKDCSSQMCIGRYSESYALRCFAWRIYNRALTDAELEQNRTLDIARFNI